MIDEGGTPAVRASDADREHAITTLRDAAGAGRLTFEELAGRIETAACAVTRDELNTLTADLPSQPDAAVRPETAVALPRASSVFGDVRRSGRWVVPAEGSCSPDARCSEMCVSAPGAGGNASWSGGAHAVGGTLIRRQEADAPLPWPASSG